MSFDLQSGYNQSKVKMMSQESKVDARTSVLIGLSWTVVGLGVAAIFAAFLLFMSTGGQGGRPDHRWVALLLSVTVTPLVLGFGWVPVVWTRHQARRSPTRMAGVMIIVSLGLLFLNAMALPVFMAI